MIATETYYTPQRVEALLRNLPYLHDRISPPDDEPRRRPQRTSAGGWHEEQMAKVADIEWALVRLPQPTRRIICLSFLWGMSLREIAVEVGVSHVTVHHHRREGVKRIAWELGWRSEEEGWGDLRKSQHT